MFVLVVFILLLSQMLAFGKTYPWGLLPSEIGRIFWIVSSLFFLFPVLASLNSRSSVYPRLKTKIGTLFGSRLWLVFLIALNGAFQVLNYFAFKHLGYQF